MTVLAFIITVYILLFLSGAGRIAWYLLKPPRDWNKHPWNANDTAKTAAAAALAYQGYRDHKEGNGLVRTWMGTSAREQERQRRFKERYKYLHPDDPDW